MTAMATAATRGCRARKTQHKKTSVNCEMMRCYAPIAQLHTSTVNSCGAHSRTLRFATCLLTFARKQRLFLCLCVKRITSTSVEQHTEAPNCVVIFANIRKQRRRNETLMYCSGSKFNDKLYSSLVLSHRMHRWCIVCIHIGLHYNRILASVVLCGASVTFLFINAFEYCNWNCFRRYHTIFVQAISMKWRT